MKLRQLLTRWSLLGALLLPIAATAAPACQSEAEQAAIAGARTAVAQGAFLLDVRTPGEFGAGHIEGAVNIPIDQLAARQGEIPDGREVVVYCRSGNRSGQAAKILRAAGRTVTDIGPMSAW